MIRYKLTDEKGYTYNNTEWGPGKTYTVSGEGDLCGPGWLHCYDDPLVAIFMNPHHANFKNPRLCKVEVSGLQLTDRGLKEGWTTMTFLEWVEVPTVTTVHRIAFGILSAKQVYNEPSWTAWADRWLSGEDRTPDAAAADAAYASDAAGAAAAIYAAADAAYAAVAIYAAVAAANAIDFPTIARQACSVL